MGIKTITGDLELGRRAQKRRTQPHLLQHREVLLRNLGKLEPQKEKKKCPVGHLLTSNKSSTAAGASRKAD